MKLTLFITLAFASFISSPTSGRTQPLSQPPLKAELPQPPDTGTPDGNRTPGGTRPGEISSCQETKESLIALTPNNGKGLTVSQYPTFWFYIPYASKYISSVEFSLDDYDQDKDIYGTTLKLSGTPGFVAISLPQDPKHSLEVKKHYHWHLFLNCEPKKQSKNKPDIVLDGYTTVVALTPALKRQLEAVKPQECIPDNENCIWYDFLNNLANRHFANPQDAAVNKAWADLLKSVGLEGIAQKPKAVAVPSPEK